MEKIDSYFQNHYQLNPTPNLVYCLSKDGEILYSNEITADNSDLKKTAPPNQQIFRIASMSKSFGAVAILMLRDAGKLSLDQKIGSIFSKDELHQSYQDITIKELLSHTSMLAGYDDPWADREIGITDHDLLEILKREVILDKTKVFFQYSNLGYMLLGLVIKKLSGIECRDFVSEKILRPLKMNSTLWNVEGINSNLWHKGYKKTIVNETIKWQEEEHLICRSSGDIFGGLWSTLNDLAIWTDFLCSALCSKDINKNNDGKEKINLYNSILKEDSRLEIQTPVAPVERRLKLDKKTNASKIEEASYCYGVNQKLSQGIYSYDHSGGLPGYGSHMRWHKESGYSIIALSNSTYYPITDLCREVLYDILN